MKIFHKTEQSGRSMVEMLGVLAIIGVLSVGGISGYSKAMAKYKLTKAQDQIAMLLINIRTAFSGSPSYRSLNNQTAIQLNIVPADMLPGGLGGSGTDIINAFSGDVTITATQNNQHFSITFAGLGTETCTSLASSDWGTEGLVSMKINSSASRNQSNLPISAVDAVSECNLPNSTNSITWEYY